MLCWIEGISGSMCLLACRPRWSLSEVELRRDDPHQLIRLHLARATSFLIVNLVLRKAKGEPFENSLILGLRNSPAKSSEPAKAPPPRLIFFSSASGARTLPHKKIEMYIVT